MARSFGWGVPLVVVLAVFASLFLARHKEHREAETVRPQSSAGEPFRVGAILPLTGSAASVGEFQRNGLLAAARRINAAGGVAGAPLELVFGDSKNEGKTGLEVFQRMLAIERPPVIIASHSGVCVPLSSHMAATGRDDVVLFATVSSAPGVPQRSPFVFRYFVTCQNESRTMARFAAEQLGLRRVAVFHINDDFGLGGYEAFRESFAQFGGEVVAVDSYEKSGTEFRGSLTKVAADQPDAVYVIGYAKAFALAIKQLRETGYEGTLLTSIGMSVPAWRKLAGEAADGAYLTASLFDPEAEDPGTRAFVEGYAAQVGADTDSPVVPNFQAAFLYDSLHMIAQAAAAGGRSAEQLRAALAAVTTHEGVVGTAGFDAEGEADMPLRVMRISGARLVPAAP